MKNKLTTVYIHFRDTLDLSALGQAFPESATFGPVMENSCIVNSYLTYKSVLDLMSHHFPNEHYFICVAGRHYVCAPSSAGRSPSTCEASDASVPPTLRHTDG